MAHVHFRLPDGLIADAKEAGISIARVTEEAILQALSGSRIEPAEVKGFEPRPLDDTDRYREGYALGEHWVETRATMHERDEIAGLRSVRWHSFPLDQHTLGKALLEAGEPADSDGRMRLARGPFAEGIIDSVIEARPVR
ncbi:MAG: hypothetical protein V3R84_10425 [Acidimicrobiia bacterium]